MQKGPDSDSAEIILDGERKWDGGRKGELRTKGIREIYKGKKIR